MQPNRQFRRVFSPAMSAPLSSINQLIPKKEQLSWAYKRCVKNYIFPLYQVSIGILDDSVFIEEWVFCIYDFQQLFSSLWLVKVKYFPFK